MEEKTIKSIIKVCQPNELSPEDLRLVELAKEATSRSYAKYSHFHVGAALRLQNGEEVIGCNQENAAFPVSLCAERTALFSAGAQYPNQPVVALAVAAKNKDGMLATPVSPCGSCRQAMIETEQRSGRPLRILLYGEECIYVMEGIKHLMPLSFTEAQL